MLYATYLFLAGWSYFKFYFTAFGIDSGWLDLGFNDTVAKGFSVLFGPAVGLSIVYGIALLTSVIIDIVSTRRRRFGEMFAAVVLVGLFPAIYWLARNAGINHANVDRGEYTSLPTVCFTAGTCDYRGKMLYLKGGLLYVYHLVYARIPAKDSSCPIDVSEPSESVPQLSLVRLAT